MKWSFKLEEQTAPKAVKGYVVHVGHYISGLTYLGRARNTATFQTLEEAIEKAEGNELIMGITQGKAGFQLRYGKICKCTDTIYKNYIHSWVKIQ